MSSAADQHPFVIVGGGIGGVATALALSRKGFAVQVLEQAEELTEIGAGIQMPPNAFRAFEALGVLGAVQAVAAYPERLVLGDLLSGGKVFEAPIGEEFIRRFGFRYALLHRGDILDVLVRACRASPLIKIACKAKVAGFNDTGDRVVVTTVGGETYEGRAMIAADGLWSESRSTLFGHELPQSDGYVVYRGVVPVSQIPEDLYSQSVTMWGGPQIDFFHYPLRRDEIFNIGASYRDPDLRVGAGYPKGDREMLLQRFAGACPHVKALLEHIDISRTWVLHDRPPIKQWSKGRVALLGDAAHPTYIYISQGACMALEDAVVLAEIVSRNDDIEAGFQAYAEARHLRTARVQFTSRQFGELYHASGVNRDLRNRILATTQPEALYDTLGWLFGGSGFE
jgi:3-hydroxybenzoate 6-monooxygenase